MVSLKITYKDMLVMMGIVVTNSPNVSTVD